MWPAPTHPYGAAAWDGAMLALSAVIGVGVVCGSLTCTTTLKTTPIRRLAHDAKHAVFVRNGRALQR